MDEKEEEEKSLTQLGRINNLSTNNDKSFESSSTNQDSTITTSNNHVQTVTPAEAFQHQHSYQKGDIKQQSAKRPWKNNNDTQEQKSDTQQSPQYDFHPHEASQLHRDGQLKETESCDQTNNSTQHLNKKSRQTKTPDQSEEVLQRPLVGCAVTDGQTTNATYMEAPAKKISESNSHTGQEVELEESNSVLSSACSSPSQNFYQSNDIDNSAGIDMKDGESSLGDGASGSIESGTSSASSYISYHVPPAPPSTPASINYGVQAGTEMDMGFSSGQMDVTCMSQLHAVDRDRNFQEMAATPLPYKPSGSYRDASMHPRDSNKNTAPSYAQGTERNTSSSSASNNPKKINENNEFSNWKVGPRYELIRILGRGSYGEVAQARDLYASSSKIQNEGSTNTVASSFVAIKRIKSAFDQEVDAIRIYREMHILRRLRGHECIIQLLDVIPPESDDLNKFNDLYLVFEYVDTDLYKLIMSPQYLTTEHIRTFLYQMLTGIKYIHSFSVIHRDLKPANILLNEDCSLKICDFGLARIINSAASSPTAGKNENSSTQTPSKPRSSTGITRQLTKHVVTRWYRAPELILIQPYTSAVDIWSVGCILAELLSMQEGSVPSYEDRVPLFPGGSCYPLSEPEGVSSKDSERRDQLSVIFGVIGTPSDEDIASITKANQYIKSLEKKPGKSLESLYPAADKDAINLLKGMLHFNPARRFTVDEALDHPFLKDVRNKEMETTAKEALIAPSFLETPRVNIKELKRQTYREVMWHQKH